MCRAASESLLKTSNSVMGKYKDDAMVDVAFSYGLMGCEDEMRKGRSRVHVYITMRVIFACFRNESWHL